MSSLEKLESTYDSYRVRIAIWNSQNSDFVIDHDITTADNRWAMRTFVLSRRTRTGKRYLTRYETFEAACAGAVVRRKNPPLVQPSVSTPTILQERTQALHEARTLARDLELEAQSASGARWYELRGTGVTPGLVRKAEIAVKEREREFMDILVVATGFGRADLLEMIKG